MAITTEEELRRFLTSKDVPCHDVQFLTGGTANYVWRITTLLGRRSIIKHAEPFVRNNASIAFPVVRMDFENLALFSLPKLLPEDENVRLPHVFHYFAEDHVMDMSDGGSKTLKESYSDPSIDVKGLGERIGAWLAKVHATTSKAENLELIKGKFDNKTARWIYRFSYNNLANALKDYGFDPELGAQINAKFGALLDTDEVCLCHGDCWPGNFLLEDPVEETEVKDQDELKDPKLTVVDWEMTRIGNGATDVGQFAAESWLLDRFNAPEETREHGGRGLLATFLKSYLKERLLSHEEKIRVAVQFGVHIGYWTTRVPWSDKEGTKTVVSIGKDMLEAVESGDLATLKRSPLGVLFET